MPAIVIGFESVPQVGDKFGVYSDTEEAQKYIEKKERKEDEGAVFFVEEGKKVVNLILKSDVQGSLEAISESFKGLPQEKIILRILETAVGDINESDIKLAKSSKAEIIGFRVKITPTAFVLAERDGVKINTFNIIYELIQAVRQIMERKVENEKVKVDIGEMKALAIFLTEKNRQIVGGKVLRGEIRKGTQVEVWRKEDYLGKGRIISIQKNKKTVDKAIKGEECGILYEGDEKMQEGDTLRLFVEESKKGIL